MELYVLLTHFSSGSQETEWAYKENTAVNRNDLYLYMLSIFAYMSIYKTNTSNSCLQNLVTAYSSQTISMPFEMCQQVTS